MAMDPWMIAVACIFFLVAISSVGSVLRDWFFNKYRPRRAARQYNERTLEFQREMRQQQLQEQQHQWQRQQELQEPIPLPPAFSRWGKGREPAAYDYV
ncbi:hypothetical protein PG996_004581 [Apiospora saccharicola]|uniref:Uncharacterized protein n=1 Tax=Apiospora saccharicola TaxID=335842 RepID=A0ABR1W792_9PEZI